MREARIIMPTAHEAVGVPESGAAHNRLQNALANQFGGYTAHRSRGGWRFPVTGKVHEESVVVYDVAVSDDHPNPTATLRNIAVEAGRMLKQHSVYVRSPGGEVTIYEVGVEQSKRANSLREELLNEPGGNVGTGERQAQPAGDFPVLGTKRTPAVGDIWRTVDGTLVAVLSPAAVLDGGFNVATLTSGTQVHRPGFPYLVNLDGGYGRRVAGDPDDHPLTLKRFVKRFD